MPSVITPINTGSGPNSGTGDSLRTAFNKVNQNFISLENSFIAAGVSSFNGSGGQITFTGTDIISYLGYVPYNSSNPSNYLSSALLDNYATTTFVTENFALKTELTPLAPKTYVDNALASYVSLVYLNGQGYLSSTNVNTYLTDYATKTYVTQQGYVQAGDFENYLRTNGYITATSIAGLASEQFVTQYVNTQFEIRSASNPDYGVSTPATGTNNTSLVVYARKNGGIELASTSSFIRLDQYGAYHTAEIYADVRKPSLPDLQTAIQAGDAQALQTWQMLPILSLVGSDATTSFSNAGSSFVGDKVLELRGGRTTGYQSGNTYVDAGGDVLQFWLSGLYATNRIDSRTNGGVGAPLEFQADNFVFQTIAGRGTDANPDEGTIKFNGQSTFNGNAYFGNIYSNGNLIAGQASISLSQLKTIVAASSSFADFQSRIAAA
jgi:hypothetical protein